MEIKDSGNRIEFDTGAVRDSGGYKMSWYLIPMQCIPVRNEDYLTYLYNAEYIQTTLFDLLYRHESDTGCMVKCINEMLEMMLYGNEYDVYDLLEQLAAQFEGGANKYKRYNWCLKLPVKSLISSATRHFFKYLNGETDEPHYVATIWNLVVLSWTLQYESV